MDTELKKYRNTLIVTGLGVIAFGLWSLVKSLMYYSLTPDITEAFHQVAAEQGISTQVLFVTISIMFFLVFFFDLSLRFYIGLSARAEGKGKIKGMLYVFCAAYLLISGICSIAVNLGSFYNLTESILDSVISLIIELTSLYTLGELIYAALKVKKNRKTMC